ncbi:GNAT family N-acetyltransferase [Arenibacter sp. GZD96]|uniref:GNAT family N-acetyltransferase n=1 Tax=Aurantibrevibacter litoralis TaxID=3106030 RepID=UPI002B003AD4|nr:GNAT family N-acetyltransferase [Arenibacter sp. GZD-96]MEA1787388.1 GNAT family N-acetyltransferase [Arenibacter sp. GZD-96]
MSKSQFDFYFDLFERGSIPPFYNKILFTEGKDAPIDDLQQKKKKLMRDNGLVPVSNVPSYLDPILKSGLKSIKFFQGKGYAILLKDHSTMDMLFAQHYRSKFRIGVKRSISRLEACFSISYKMYHGHIEKRDYDFLMSSLRKMLERRFQQLGEKNDRLQEWTRFEGLLYPLINSNKASIFVIFDDKKPIDIAFNYHLPPLFFSAVSSYDIDYSKFGLGNIDLYKQVDWCLKNGYGIFDMGFGDLEYKLKWANHTYDFERHLVFGNDALNKVKVYYIKMLYHCKAYLKSKNIDALYKAIKIVLKGGKKKRKTLANTETTFSDYKIVPFAKTEKHQDLVQLDPNDAGYTFLRKPIYDFLYSHTEHISNVAVFELEPYKTYWMKGKENSQTITFTT